MARPARLLNSFAALMKRDISRDNLPQDSLWNVVDVFSEILGAPLRRRGGYLYASQNFATAVTATADHVTAGIWVPFSNGAVNVAFDEDGRAYAVTSNAATTDIGAVIATKSPVFYSDMLIVPDSAGSAGPQKVTYSGGTTFAVTGLSGSPPAGKYALVYKDVLWLAASAATGDRIWFSTAGNPEDTWDTANKYLDVSYPITGMAALNNAVFVFSLNRTARVRGSIPPPDTDFIVDDPIFDVGCTDSRSIVNYRDKVIWANAQGLFISDGTAMDDLTAICGMKNWWRDVMSGIDGFATGSEYDVSTWTIAGGVYRDFYVYAIMNGTTKVDAGVIDLKKYTWTRVKNLDADFFWRQGYPDELYFGRRGAARVGSVSNMFSAATASSADADGTSILPVVETGFFGADGSLKTLRMAFLEYDIRDPGSSNPYLTVSYIDSPEETSYTALTPNALETTAIAKEHFAINQPVRGVAFKIAQTGASSDTRIYGLDITANAREGNR